jgi:hypothetical protein
MWHILTDGIMLNQIDSWFMVLFKHGAGWGSVLIALIALWKARKPAQRYYFAYMFNKLDLAIRLANVVPNKPLPGQFEEEFSPFLAGMSRFATKKRKDFLEDKRKEYLQKLMDVL